MVHVEVTESDIQRGIPCNNNCCPIVLALRRATGDEWSVDGMAAEVNGTGRVKLPSVARHFVLDFDHARPVKPFAFDLE